jgi:cyanate lyase
MIGVGGVWKWCSKPNGNSASPILLGMSSSLRNQLTEKIVVNRITKKLTWKQLAEACARSEVWTTSALLGQQAMGPAEAAAAGQLLDLSADEIAVLELPPSKGALGGVVPTDPLIYRFHEVVEVYGTTLKELIHEKFGDGIMSAIDFEMAVDKLPDPKGDRVKVTMHGKFLAYRKW